MSTKKSKRRHAAAGQRAAPPRSGAESAPGAGATITGPTDRFLLSANGWVKILIVVQLALFALQFSPDLSTNGDDAHYFALGGALASGKGYCNVSAPGSPEETQSPIVFPLLIGLVRAIRDSVLAPKIFFSFAGCLVTLMCYLLFRKSLLALLFPLLLLVACSSFIAAYSLELLSEIPYLLFTLLALILRDMSIERPRNRLLFWLTIIASIIPVNCRSIGLSFSAAWIIVSLWEGRCRYAIAHAVVVVSVGILFRSLTSFDNPYLLQLFQKNSYDPERGYVTALEMLARIAQNVKQYGGDIVGYTLAPLPLPAGTPARAIAGVVVAAVCIVGWVRGIVGRWRILCVYVACFFGVLCMWQTEWSGERFIAGVAPFLYLLLLTGIDAIACLRPPGWGNGLRRVLVALARDDGAPVKAGWSRAVWIAVAVIALLNVNDQRARATCTRALSPDWRNYYSCADWVRLHTPGDAVVMSRKPELFYVRSQRRGLVYPFSHDVEKVIDVIRREKVSYVVMDNFAWTGTTARYLYPVVTSHPERFRLVYALRNPDTVVLEVAGP